MKRKNIFRFLGNLLQIVKKWNKSTTTDFGVLLYRKTGHTDKICNLNVKIYSVTLSTMTMTAKISGVEHGLTDTYLTLRM